MLATLGITRAMSPPRVMTLCQRMSSSAPRANGSLAVVFGGFGFTERQIAKHESLYREHGFDVEPVLSSVAQMITPRVARQRAAAIAARIRAADAPTVIHTVSGSCWTAMMVLAQLEPAWRDARVRALVFDSCPPKSDVYAFGGWLAWLAQAKAGVPSRLAKPALSQLFHPVRPCFGIDATWTAENDAWMFGDAARGRRAREMPARAGASLAECAALAEAAASRARAEETDAASGGDDACVVPKDAACLFVRGRNDPVLEPQYVDAFYAHLKARSTAAVEWTLFDRAQHAMAVVEAPEQYKAQHVDRLLRQVPEWAGS